MKRSMAETGKDNNDPRFRVIDRSEYSRYIENILENIDLAIFMIVPGGEISFWNSRMEVLFGSREGAIGKNLREVFPQFAEESSGIVWEDVLIRNVLGEARTIEVKRFPVDLPGGEKLPCSIRAFPVHDENGIRLGACTVIRDVSREVMLEEEVLHKAKTRSLAHMASSLAHEIRNPLNSLSLNLQLLREELAEQGNAGAQNKTWNIVQNEINRLNTLLKDFMEFSKPRSPRLEKMNPNNVITEALGLLAEQARQKDIEIIVEYGNLPEILLDQSKLAGAFYNIALNAIEILDRAGRMEVITFRRGDWVGIRIQDNGPGIPEDEIEHVFDLFFTTRDKGTGLGLTIASRYIEEQHGHITVDSTPGKGAAFTIYLPVKIVSELDEKSGT